MPRCPVGECLLALTLPLRETVPVSFVGGCVLFRFLMTSFFSDSGLTTPCSFCQASDSVAIIKRCTHKEEAAGIAQGSALGISAPQGCVAGIAIVADRRVIRILGRVARTGLPGLLRAFLGRRRRLARVPRLNLRQGLQSHRLQVGRRV